MTPRLAAVLLVASAGWACIPEEAPPPAAPAAATPEDAGTPAAPSAAGDTPTDSKGLLKTVESMKDQLKDRPRDFNVDMALGNLFYDNGKYIDAIEYYTSALDRVASVEPQLQAGGKPEKIPNDCLVDLKASLTQGGSKNHTIEEAISWSKSNPSDATACLSQLVSPLAGVHARRGNSWYLIGNVDKARGDHVVALKLDPNNAEALFFSGAVELETAHGDPAKLAAGRAFWDRLLKVAPDHPRAELVRQTIPRINELFGAKPEAPPMAQGSASAAAPQLPAGMMEAMQNVQHTPEMEAQLDKTTEEGEALLEKGQWQAALDTLKQVMPLRPSGRTALGMGIALRELGKPTAERVLMQAARLPGGDPVRAKYELAIYYEKNDPAQAKSLYQEVQDDPKIGAKAKARLATLH